MTENAILVVAFFSFCAVVAICMTVSNIILSKRDDD